MPKSFIWDRLSSVRGGASPAISSASSARSSALKRSMSANSGSVSFPLAKVGAQSFTDPRLVSEKVGEIVVDLVSYPKAASEMCNRLDVRPIITRKSGSKITGDAEKFRRLQIDDTLVVGKCHIGRAPAHRLDDFSGADAARGF